MLSICLNYLYIQYTGVKERTQGGASMLHAHKQLAYEFKYYSYIVQKRPLKKLA